MPVKVAFLIRSLRGGGAERVVSNLTTYLPDSIEKYIITYYSDVVDYPFKGEFIYLNFFQKDSKEKPRKSYFNSFKKILRQINTIRKIKNDRGIQVTVSFMPHPNFFNFYSFGKDKKILSVRNQTSLEDTPNKITSLLYGFMYRHANLIVAVSRGVKQDLISNYGIEEKNIQVIYNPYDIAKIHTLYTETFEENYQKIFENPVVINIGRFSYQKGKFHLIRAFADVKKIHTNLKLVLLGQGELEDECKCLVEELGLTNEVFFLGFQKNPFKFIKKSKIFVFPSLFEGFPNALVEAMACGIPVISADCRSGPREILAPNSDFNTETLSIEFQPYGILVPVCDGKQRSAKVPLTVQEKMLANAMIELLGEPSLWEKYSQAATIRANDFRMENIVPLWERVITE